LRNKPRPNPDESEEIPPIVRENSLSEANQNPKPPKSKNSRSRSKSPLPQKKANRTHPPNTSNLTKIVRGAAVQTTLLAEPASSAEENTPVDFLDLDALLNQTA
jgi:hypothetical protein